MFSLQNKIYMIAEDETEETLALIAILEGISITTLYETIDINRSAGCGFARAAKIFAANYLRSFMENHNNKVSGQYLNALALQRAIMAVANDAEHNDSSFEASAT